MRVSFFFLSIRNFYTRGWCGDSDGHDLPFSVPQRKCTVVHCPFKNILCKRNFLIHWKERMWCGCWCWSPALVEVQALHGEVAAGAVHQARARVENLKNRTCSARYFSFTSFCPRLTVDLQKNYQRLFWKCLKGTDVFSSITGLNSLNDKCPVCWILEHNWVALVTWEGGVSHSQEIHGWAAIDRPWNSRRLKICIIEFYFHSTAYKTCF